MVVDDAGHRVDDVGEPDPARRRTPGRTPRWPRCRPPGRSRRPARPAWPGRRPGTPRRRAGRTPRSTPATSPPGEPLPGPGPARPGPARSAASCPAGEAWARVDPSTNSTIEWITDCGWTTTWMRSNGTSKSRWASMTSRPLLTRVAEFVVMTGPMAQVGWASACCGVTSSSSSRRIPRNGPPLAVTTRRSTSSAVPPRRHWASAECSLSTGTIWPGLAAALTSGPPTMSDSLLASARVVPACERGERRRQADRAGDAVEDDVGGAAGELGRGVGTGEQLGPVCGRLRPPGRPRPRPRRGRRRTRARRRPSRPAAPPPVGPAASRLPPALSAVMRNRSGAACATSIAWVPIEPVDPSRVTVRGEEVTSPLCLSPPGRSPVSSWSG